jgi:hypothetical protein
MSIERGAVPITGFISPTDSSDVYATHQDIYGKGGFRAVTTIASRNQITNERRSEGMLVFVLSEVTMYQLLNGTSNENWVVVNSEGGGGNIDLSLPQYYIYEGDASGTAAKSTGLIQVRLDIIALRQELDALEAGGAVVKRDVDDLNNLHLEGFVQSPIQVDGVLTTERGPDCLLTNIPAGGDVNMDTHGIKNLQQSPTGNLDAISAQFLWDLMHDEVEIIWPQAV